MGYTPFFYFYSTYREATDHMDNTLTHVLTRAAKASGAQLWGYEWGHDSGARVLRVYLDDAFGVSVEACAVVSRQVAAMLDAECDLKTAYTLEVSSPGIHRKLFKVSQYQTYRGHLISCQLRSPVQDSRKIKGQLLNVTDELIELESGDRVYSIPYSNIDQANVLE
ncbi:MAG: ribosome maturation factor RimP [Legionellales bacterium]|nr:ribosome maturation factor RimP [Legionellales bacterium]